MYIFKCKKYALKISYRLEITSIYGIDLSDRHRTDTVRMKLWTNKWSIMSKPKPFLESGLVEHT